ncbi:hypothetical protein NQZ68_025546 [Dissostichus eleginoides]|nr:hypothetical protein NQZ68_025546 [Dissostichus eleginoides]
MAGVVHDQEAPTCRNGRCGEGRAEGNKRNAQHLEQSQEGKVTEDTELEKIPTEDIWSTVSFQATGALNHLTCLQLLDTMHELRRVKQLQTAKVKSVERRRSFQIYSQERHRVLQSVAFCRRAT